MCVEDSASEQANDAGHLDATNNEELRSEVGSQAEGENDKCLDDGAHGHESEVLEYERDHHSIDQTN